MDLAGIRETRRIAVVAIERGLIDPSVLWDLAYHCALDGATTPRELFEGVLTPQQLDEIAGPPSKAEADAELDRLLEPQTLQRRGTADVETIMVDEDTADRVEGPVRGPLPSDS